MRIESLVRLMKCFSGSFINQNGEFIAHAKANEYFSLEYCANEINLKCKVLEWLSRAAYKTCPYKSDKANDKFHDFMLEGINKFLGTDFDKNDMEQIYTYLGNGCNRFKTMRFVNSGYDMAILKGSEEDG